jgi:hypothetical protein
MQFGIEKLINLHNYELLYNNDTWYLVDFFGGNNESRD